MLTLREQWELWLWLHRTLNVLKRQNLPLAARQERCHLSLLVLSNIFHVHRSLDSPLAIWICVRVFCPHRGWRWRGCRNPNCCFGCEPATARASRLSRTLGVSWGSPFRLKTDKRSPNPAAAPMVIYCAVFRASSSSSLFERSTGGHLIEPGLAFVNSFQACSPSASCCVIANHHCSSTASKCSPCLILRYCALIWLFYVVLLRQRNRFPQIFV